MIFLIRCFAKQMLRLAQRKSIISLFIFLTILLCVRFWSNQQIQWNGGNTEIKYLNPCSLTVWRSGVKTPRRCITELPAGIPILTAECPSRLGNQIFIYAILYAISIYNNRQAYMSPRLSNYISKYFKASMDTLDEPVFEFSPWDFQQLGAKIPNNIKNLSSSKNIKFCCYPQTYKYFHEIRPQILNEFQFHDDILERADKELAKAKSEFQGINSEKTIFVGVHIRRADYLTWKVTARFILPSVSYYQGAMQYFTKKYSSSNVIFVVASDDIPWCRKTFSNIGFEDQNIHYLPETAQEDGGYDLAIVTRCNHVIFGIGTFGFWAGYLNPGEVVYCSDCHPNESVWLQSPAVYGGDYRNFVLPEWVGMSRNGTRTNLIKL